MARVETGNAMWQWFAAFILLVHTCKLISGESKTLQAVFLGINLTSGPAYKLETAAAFFITEYIAVRAPATGSVPGSYN